MIYLLHGEGKTAAYARLGQIVKIYPDTKPITFSKENTRDDLYMAIFGTSIIEEETILVAQNFLKDKKVSAKDEIFKNTPKDKVLIFWEQALLTPAQVKNAAAFAQIEVFKPEQVIFHFLDSLAPDSKTPLRLLQDLQNEDRSTAYSTSLIWHLSTRILLMVLAKMGANASLAGKISGRPLAPWQWDKIKMQSRPFNLDSLQKFLKGTLKVDLLIKTGKTNLDEPTLASFLLLKYLKS
ncbi:MAG: hypothetical protein WD988_02770 [Candidatus Curtissbacteria bacterium]